MEIAWALVAAEDQGAVDKSFPELVVQLEGEGGDAVHLIHYFHIMISLFLPIDLKKRFYDFVDKGVAFIQKHIKKFKDKLNIGCGESSY